MALPVPSGTCDSVCGRGEAPKLPVHLLEAGHHLNPLSGAFPEHVSRTNSGGGGQQLGETGFAEHPCNAAPRYLGGPHTGLSLLFPLEMDSMGFRKRP